ncbi:IclR family transcriptional regulator [Halogeometricum borinquense]|uniref:IclR family transcriptional regulator n=1 Tax=Halogeometricum borinquense TaxID=60847 RepID=A0A482SYB0_9EURY|nr:IclR family transcriptional regulator [Halogeometricum borinquense]RYJ08544.1 IclR family transcriptional regulator [Halogeometricum borinquense]
MPLGKGELTTTATSLHILELIVDHGWVTLRGLVEETGLAKSTVHKHLSTLRANDYIVKEGERYTLGLYFLTVGKRAVELRDSYQLVEQKVRELGSRTDAEVDFTVEENGRLILMFEAAGATNESTFGTGTEFFLHNTAAGKAILATYADSKRDEILDTQGLPATTNKTIQSREALHAELEQIRENGYALNDGECVEGYRTVSSVIKRPNGSVLGAISAGGPAYRIDQSRLKNELADHVRSATAEVTESLVEAQSTL